MSTNHLKIDLVPGKDAPKYGNTTELKCDQVFVTEQGTEKNLPIVDFVLDGPDGKQYLVVFTGRLILSLAAVIRGVNLRNHQTEEP